MRKIVIGGRGSGKTMLLVKYSSETELPICVYTEREASVIKGLATKLDIKIPEPLVVTKAPRPLYIGHGINKILVDDGDFILESLLSRFLQVPGIKVDMFTADITSAMVTDLNSERLTFDPKGLEKLIEFEGFLPQIHAKPVENDDQNGAKID